MRGWKSQCSNDCVVKRAKYEGKSKANEGLGACSNFNVKKYLSHWASPPLRNCLLVLHSMYIMKFCKLDRSITYISGSWNWFIFYAQRGSNWQTHSYTSSWLLCSRSPMCLLCSILYICLLSYMLYIIYMFTADLGLMVMAIRSLYMLCYICKCKWKQSLSWVFKSVSFFFFLKKENLHGYI